MKTLRRLLKLLLARPETRLVLGAATLLLALSAHAEEAHGEHGIEINWWGWPNNEHPPLGWLIVNFAIFMFLLVRFAKKPMIAGMAKRHATIKNAIADNEAAHAKAKAAYEASHGKLQNVEDESKKLIDSTKEDGKLERDKIIEGAESYTRRMRQDVQTLISQEGALAQQRLQLEVARTALAQAEAMLQRGVTDADRERLFNESITALEKNDEALANVRRLEPRRAAGGAA